MLVSGLPDPDEAQVHHEKEAAKGRKAKSVEKPERIS
jgi:hypothetical protein